MTEEAPMALAGDGTCPFLIGVDGAWRMTVPDRDHRCAAFIPATSLAPSKQARLCLTASHAGCATYIASTKARQARTGTPESRRSGRWALARTTPVIEEVGGVRATLGSLLADRRSWPAIPALLLAALLVALGLSGTWGQGPLAAASSLTPAGPTLPPVPRATPSPSIVPTAEPSSIASPQVTEPPTSDQTPTPAPPSATPTPTPRATPAYRRYVVQPGDTLSKIAKKFATTVAAIVALNHLPNANTLSVGEVLLIP